MPFLDYTLPPHLIAQEPAADRDQSRLLVLRRRDGALAHHRFADLPELLDPGDLLVLNDTRVVPARLLGKRERTGGPWEGLYLGQTADGSWKLLCRTRGWLRSGETIAVDPGPLRLTLLGRAPGGGWLARPEQPGSPEELLEQSGRVPLPPYIRKGRAVDADRERYQTVYGRRPGAVAAPTAGLHFTPALFERLQDRGIERAFVTLHVGRGTFLPLRGDDPSQEKLHAEWCELPAATAEAVAKCRMRGSRVVAVGTTSVRTLETAVRGGRLLAAWSGETDLFIHAPYDFRVVDALVTNFHLPRTSLLLLVGALAGEELLRRAYREAVARAYRFYSYGDAMLVV